MNGVGRDKYALQGIYCGANSFVNIILFTTFNYFITVFSICIAFFCQKQTNHCHLYC